MIQHAPKDRKRPGPRPRPALLVAALLVPAVTQAAPPCGDWDLVPTPNVGDSVTRLRAVTALSSDDAWAVGLWRDASGVFGPMAFRWDGTTWSETDLPDTSHLGGLPETEGVEAASNGDVWVVGKVFTGYPTDNLPLLLRWRERLVGLRRHDDAAAADGLPLRAPRRPLVRSGFAGPG